MSDPMKAEDVIDVMQDGDVTGDPGVYWLRTFTPDVDYADKTKGLWIWSIGKNLVSGKVLAATDTRFYQNPLFECLWLR